MDGRLRVELRFLGSEPRVLPLDDLPTTGRGDGNRTRIAGIKSQRPAVGRLPYELEFWWQVGLALKASLLRKLIQLASAFSALEGSRCLPGLFRPHTSHSLATVDSLMRTQLSAGPSANPAGIEPASPGSMPGALPLRQRNAERSLERVGRLELPSSAWKTEVLPLDDTRMKMNLRGLEGLESYLGALRLVRQSSQLNTQTQPSKLERSAGIGPAFRAWEARVLPLDDDRMKILVPDAIPGPPVLIDW